MTMTRMAIYGLAGKVTVTAPWWSRPNGSTVMFQVSITSIRATWPSGTVTVRMRGLPSPK
jgi:hypothetical protein